MLRNSFKKTLIINYLNCVTVCSIFEGIEGEKADRVLGPAPSPGKDMTLNARTLMRVAIALDLPWRPTSSAEYITLQRSATIIRADDVRRDLVEALADMGVDGNFDVTTDQPLHDIILPASEPGQIEIGNLNFDSSKNQFQAVIYAPSRSNAQKRMKVSGGLDKLVKVPVLRETLYAGTIIGQRDITFKDMRERTVSSSTIRDANALIGMTPRNTITHGNLISRTDVEQPEIVSRGALVTMIVEHGGMQLSAQGKALENGAAGDIIRVSNSTSSKTIQGRVTGKNEITVESF
jgi:flagella basal body P-ring formation protein FlgA